MERKIVVDNEFITLWYYHEYKIIHHQFHKFTQGQTLRDAFNAGVELMIKNTAQKWLSDDRKNTLVSEDDLDWTRNVWSPSAITAGWRYWALLPPEKAVGKLNTNRIIKYYADNTDVAVKIFSNPDEGLKWLIDQ